MPLLIFLFFFFFNDTATTEIYTLSLHDALPIFDQRDQLRTEIGPDAVQVGKRVVHVRRHHLQPPPLEWRLAGDRKSTRLNSSHLVISYAVFCLKKKKNKITIK